MVQIKKGFKKMEEDEAIQSLTSLRGGGELNYLGLKDEILSSILGLESSENEIMQSLKRISKKI